MADSMAVDLVVVGAGAAGLAAAKTAAGLSLSVTLLEASHRIGGRAYTEELAPGVPFDLGPHYMHSASLNPFVAMADEFGIAYRRDQRHIRIHKGGGWASDRETRAWRDFETRCGEAVGAAARAGRDVAIADVTKRKSPWTPLYDYWISVLASVDPDEVSTLGYASYNDTGEDWPVVDGYGALVARMGRDAPVTLNATVERLDWGGKDVRATTRRGVVRARAAIVTVSNGVLAAGNIRFDPALPDWKLAAIEALPLGDGNRIAFHVDGEAFEIEGDCNVSLLDGDSEPMNFMIRPYGHDIVIARIAGRFSAWLERSGPQAMMDQALERLAKLYGNDISKHIHRWSYSAWRGDPLIGGAYSCARPGMAHKRADMAAAIDDRLFFAGEATSREFFATVHGAYLSGVAAAEAAAKALGRTGPATQTEKGA